MKLINFRGLNCYQTSLISIASFLGIDYSMSFAELWSETDFTYDEIHGVYLTNKMLCTLEALGMKIATLNCASQDNVEEHLHKFGYEEFFIIGMDSFYIPWCPFYNTVHDQHFFITKKENPNLLSCFDPTYRKEDIHITINDCVPYISDIRRVSEGEAKRLNTDIEEEAMAIIGNHPKTRERLLAEFSECINDKRKNALLAAKYITTMINNRYLYKHYIDNSPYVSDKCKHFFDNIFFRQWEMVKNGLYKAHIMKNNESVINEVSELFSNLVSEEIDMARKFLSFENR